MALFERGVSLQERDLNVLLGFFECRVMTLAHVADLYFDGKSEAAKKRVQKLKADGYLRERPRRIGEPSILFAGIKTYRVLKERGLLERFPDIGATAFEKRAQVSDLTLKHELEVMDVRAAFFRAVKEQPHLTIAEFGTWPTLYQFTVEHASPTHGRRLVTVKPDGFIRIHESTGEGTFEHLFFLEVDRSTESLDILAQKAACYLGYYQSGGLAVKLGGKREDYKTCPFRVLLICKSEVRRNNIAKQFLTNEPPIYTQVWMSISSNISKCCTGKIWRRPTDYLETPSSDMPLLTSL